MICKCGCGVEFDPPPCAANKVFASADCRNRWHARQNKAARALTDDAHLMVTVQTHALTGAIQSRRTAPFSEALRLLHDEILEGYRVTLFRTDVDNRRES